MRPAESDGTTCCALEDKAPACVETLRPVPAAPMLALVELTFAGEIVQWRGPAPYYFVPLPEPESREVQEWSFVSYGWGVIPVTVHLGDSTWQTSLFPKDGGYLLPLRLAVRKAEGVEDGDTVTVRLRISTDT